MEKTKKFLCNCDPIDCIDYFFIMKNYQAIHPYILSISKEDNNGFYTIIEKPFPKIPLKVRYKLKPKKTENIVTFKVKGLVFIYPNIAYSCSKSGTKTELKVKIKAKGIPLATHFFANKVMKGVELNVEAINKTK